MPFQYRYLSDEFNQVYWVIEQASTFMTGMAFVTIILACGGIVGLSLFSIRRRTKEIGVRKVLGASVFGVTWLLLKQTVLLVGLSILLAIPGVWLLMTQWLNTFSRHTPFPWWVFALASLLAILIALLTVSFQSVKAALMNPVTSLRRE